MTTQRYDFEFGEVIKFNTKIKFGRGALSEARSLIFRDEKLKTAQHFIITDPTVDALYGALTQDILSADGFKVRRVICQESEQAKSFAEYQRLCLEILENGFNKRSVIISLGGGVVNNVAGFIASTLHRGVQLAHIPTSVLAQVDAAIDFKQALNTGHGKNLIGSYYPSSIILVDPSLLSTLEDRHFFNGLAETIKHALTQDESLYRVLSEYKGDVRNPVFIDQVIRRSIELKTSVMNNMKRDDTLEEMIKQYGHALGHAFEHASKGKLLHGEAIAIGMCLSAEIAFEFKLCEKNIVDEHYRIFEKYNLPTAVPTYIDEHDIFNALRFDKYFIDDHVMMGLLNDVGRPAAKNGSFCLSVPIKTIEAVMRRSVASKLRIVKQKA